MYDFNQLRRAVKIQCKKRVNFKRAAFLQRIIDNDKWSLEDINKIISQIKTKSIFYAPIMKDIIRSESSYACDAITFSTEYYENNNYEYVICNRRTGNDPYAIVFNAIYLKPIAKIIKRMSNLKVFL
jgi:hypothetical protein